MNIDQLFDNYGNYILSLKNTKTLKALEIQIPQHWVIDIITEPFTLKKVDEGHYFLVAPKGGQNPEIKFQSITNKLISLVEFNLMLEKKQIEFKEMVDNIEKRYQTEIDNLIQKYSENEQHNQTIDEPEQQIEEYESKHPIFLEDEKEDTEITNN